MAGRLRRLRERAGLTQRELALRAGLSLDAVRAYERGTRTMLLTTAVDLALALNTSLDTLAGFRQIRKDRRRPGKP